MCAQPGLCRANHPGLRYPTASLLPDMQFSLNHKKHVSFLFLGTLLLPLPQDSKVSSQFLTYNSKPLRKCELGQNETSFSPQTLAFLWPHDRVKACWFSVCLPLHAGQTHANVGCARGSQGSYAAGSVTAVRGLVRCLQLLLVCLASVTAELTAAFTN